MIGGTLDVMVVGDDAFGAADEVRRAGFTVESSGSLVGALVRLSAGGASLVIASCDVALGREREVFAALHDAGAAAVVPVYPPHLAWRAPRALHAGADDSLVLPVDPGAFRVRAARFAGRPATLAAAEREPLPAPPPAAADENLARDFTRLGRQVGDLDRLLAETVELLARRSGAKRTSILLADRENASLALGAHSGLPDPSPRPPRPFEEGLAGAVARSGRPLVTDDASRIPGASRGGYTGRSCLLLPLATPAGLIGVACMTERESGRPFTDADAASLGPLADEAAQAIENAHELRRMRELATSDGLTGLANRRQFDVALERELQRARRYDRPLTLGLFDVDHFKKYNDTCGHQAGDRALATIGALLKTSLREVDLVARYGGEEFAVILPETGAHPGAGVSPFPFLERLRQRVERAAFTGEENLPGGRLTISGGIACFPADASSSHDLIAEADRALYAAKAHGRNVVIYRGAPLRA